ncbi:MAG: type IV pilus biogenesis/stability protein PilW [Gammaproteobacteria bacterium]|nr:type IV pilus biogenesis/stability protein PilW [Gammaproteobacteria bacterium]
MLLPLLPAMSACGAISIAGVLASTTASTAVRAIDEQMQESAEQAPHREEVAEANLNVAVEYMRRGNYKGALERLDRAREAEPRNSYIYSVYGLVYQRLGETVKAEQNFRRSLELDKSSPENMNNYGQFLCQQGRADEATKLFLKAAGDPLYRTPEVALTNAGLCAQRGGDVARATRYLNDALARNPDAPAALLALSEIEFGNARYPEARKLFERYLKVATHTPRSLWLGIRIAGKLGDKDTEASYSMLLRNKYPDSVEAGYLKGPTRS